MITIAKTKVMMGATSAFLRGSSNLRRYNMTNQEALEWFAGEINHLRSLTRTIAPQRRKLEAYEQAVDALRTATANDIRPYWYGKLNARY